MFESDSRDRCDHYGLRDGCTVGINEGSGCTGVKDCKMFECTSSYAVDRGFKVTNFCRAVEKLMTGKFISHVYRDKPRDLRPDMQKHLLDVAITLLALKGES